MAAPFVSSPIPPGRTKPRISANKLAEYLTVGDNPFRRQEIIRDQYSPPSIKVNRYEDASNAAVGYFRWGQDVTTVHDAVQRLKQRQAGLAEGSFALQKNRNCLDALQAFLRLVQSPAMSALKDDDIEFLAGPNTAPMLHKAGVAISVRPEIILHGTDSKGPYVGAVKLHTCQGFQMDQKAADYVGTLLREYADLHLAGERRSDYRRCYVLDIFAEQLFPAPKATVKRMALIEAACKEIANNWPKP